MHLSPTLAAILSLTTFFSSTLAQAPPSSSSPGSKLVQIVRVSDDTGALKYFPDQITAEPGSFVMFEFYPKNHTVTESLFANPCQPLPATNQSATRPGIRSGFHPVQPNLAPGDSRPAFVVQVNDTKPIWIYCAQQGHCAKGMAMVINQVPGQNERTLERYKLNAAAAVAVGSLSVAGGYGSTATGTGTGTAVTSTSTGANTGISSTATATAPSSSRITATSTLPGSSSGTTGPTLATPNSPIQSFKPGNSADWSKRVDGRVFVAATLATIASVFGFGLGVV